MNKSIWIGVGLFLAVVLGSFLFLGGTKGQKLNNQMATPTPTLTPTLSEGTPPESGEVRDLQVVGNEYSFSPATISLKKGEKVSLTFRNTGKMPHNLTLPELGISTKTISGGQSDTVEFTADKVGIFTFYCSIGTHQNLGMEGSLEVK